MKLFPVTAKDGYKVGHIFQYEKGTKMVYANFTPRSDRLYTPRASSFYKSLVLNIGVEGFCKWFLIDLWSQEFFNKPKEEVVARYKRRIDNYLGKDTVTVDHIAELHDLGYLPIMIKALPEGALSPMKVPVLTVKNTRPEFFWVTNMLETVISDCLWKSYSQATIAYEIRTILQHFFKKTGSDMNLIGISAHDFSARGMGIVYDAAANGFAHLSCFIGTDTLSAIDYAEDYYQANSDTEMVGVSVAATEHSVQCLSGKDNERETYRRLVQDVYPKGIVSIVSDTWDYWNVLTNIVPSLKEEILSREVDGWGLCKVVIRPDSGVPIDIVCGDANAPKGSPANKGSLELLWETFGGEINKAGYKVLNPKIGLIYGDGMNPQTIEAILTRMEKEGWAASNLVFGVGSYCYQYLTRDTFGFAIKATYGEVGDEQRDIFKDPITDGGTKKSAKGLLRVEQTDTGYVLHDSQTPEQELQGALEEVFVNGVMVRETPLSKIRERVEGSL